MTYLGLLLGYPFKPRLFGIKKVESRLAGWKKIQLLKRGQLTLISLITSMSLYLPT